MAAAMRPYAARVALAVLAATAAPASGCRHAVGDFVWVDSYKDPLQGDASAYVISQGDVIAVRVWNQEHLSGRARVRSDGMISLAFVNDVQAAGLEPAALARQLEAQLKEYVKNPVVAVALEEAALVEVSVIGEVMKPGVYQVDRNAGLLKALANAGGLTQLANRDEIFVLRARPGGAMAKPVRVRFTYEALAHASGASARFRLRNGDVVVVE